jgi:hypothetical protein
VESVEAVMPRQRAEHGTYAAYRAHLRDKTAVCEPCRDAARAQNRARSNSAPARAAKAAAKDAPSIPKIGPPPTEPDSDHISRLEVLKEQLETSRQTIAALSVNDPARVYLLMREQRETLREISEIQGNGQVKGVTLADQLEAAREARRSRQAGA